METMKEVSEEIGAILVWYIVANKIDLKAVDILLKHIFKHSEEFVKEHLSEEEFE